jgi:hypothetical protein
MLIQKSHVRPRRRPAAAASTCQSLSVLIWRGGMAGADKFPSSLKFSFRRRCDTTRGIFPKPPGNEDMAGPRLWLGGLEIAPWSLRS